MAKSHACFPFRLRLAYAVYRLASETIVHSERHVRLFKNGRNQALRIPRDLELPGDEAILRREGNRLIVEPVARPSLMTVLATLKPIEEAFPPVESLAAEPIKV
jgi:antitoxin VapB